MLMQRHKSSAIDVTAFSFAKPAARQGGFSLRALPKQNLIGSGASRDASVSKPKDETRTGQMSSMVKDR